MRKQTLKNFVIFIYISFILCSLIKKFVLSQEINLNYLHSKEERFIEYLNDLNKDNWYIWQSNYLKSILNTHDKLYLQVEKNGNARYFNDGKIKCRPLIVWSVYNEKKISEPEIITSSGSSFYDKFYCNVLKQSKVPDFPEQKQRVLMFDGELEDFILYLKNKIVLPTSFELDKPIKTFQINLDKI